MAFPITVNAINGGSGIELSAGGIKNKVQVSLEVGKCGLVDLKGMGALEDHHCGQYLGVNLGHDGANMDFNMVPRRKTCGLNGQGKLAKVRHCLTRKLCTFGKFRMYAMWLERQRIIKEFEEVKRGKEPKIDEIGNGGCQR